MESYKITQARSRSSRRRWTYTLIAIAVIVVIIVIVVPCAILIPRSHRPPAATVLLPLYIYPDNNSTWAPLYTAIQSNPKLRFTVIINPSTGPGNGTSPDPNYSEQIAQLNAISTVKTFGYVRTGYASRALSDVLSDINTYSGWASSNVSLAMSGIFLDESPHQYNSSAASFMRTVTASVKSSSGLTGLKTVVRNPGVVPDPVYDDINTDVTVIFESDYAAYQSKLTALRDQPKKRAACAILVYGAAQMSVTALGNYLGGLSRIGEYLFVTDNTQDYYESWGNDWSMFANAMPVA